MSHLRPLKPRALGTTRFMITTTKLSKHTSRTPLLALLLPKCTARFQSTNRFPTHFQPQGQTQNAWEIGTTPSQQQFNQPNQPIIPQIPQQFAPPPPPPPPKSSGIFRWIFKLGGFFFCFTFGFMTGVVVFSKGTIINISTHTSLTSVIVEDQLLKNPYVRKLNSNPEFSMSQPHRQFPPLMSEISFTASMIGVPGKVAIPPMVWTTENGSEGVVIMYLGGAMCGHPGFVHGGMIATILDEGLARTCFAALPNKVGMTANLTIDYRKPCSSNQFVVMKARTTKVEGRKAWVEGRLETLPQDGSEGVLIAEGKALFIEPRNAAVSKNLMRIAGMDEKRKPGIPDPAAVDAPGANVFPPKAA